MAEPRWNITFDSAEVVNLETGERRTFTALPAARIDSVAGHALNVFDDAIEEAGGAPIQERDDG